MSVKRLVCLANSRKLSGRCVAGKEIADRRVLGWVRPVSDREHQEVSEYERQYADGSDPRVLDIVDVPLLAARADDWQQENWLLDPDCYWKKVGRCPWDRLAGLTDPVDPLWFDGSSTYHGRNDRVPLDIARHLRSSLRLIQAPELTLAVFAPGADFGNPKRRVQARFRHGGSDYRLWVTDPGIERGYLAGEDGVYRLGESFLTVSLGEAAEDGYCYKLVAAIISRPEKGTG